MNGNGDQLMNRTSRSLVSLCGWAMILGMCIGAAASSDTLHSLDTLQSVENVALVRVFSNVPDKPDLRIDEGEHGQAPYVMRLANGELLCAYGSSKAKSAILRRSVDSGRTWSDPIHLGIVDSIMCQTKDGRVWLNNRRGHTMYSEDNGRTWSNPVTLADERFHDTGVGKPGGEYSLFMPIGELSNGDFLWSAWANFPPEETWFDPEHLEGIPWRNYAKTAPAQPGSSFPPDRARQGMIQQKATVVLDRIADGKAHLVGPFVHPQLGSLDEFHMVETDKPGRMVAIIRMQATGDYYYTSSSDDYGRSWEPARPAPIWHSPVQSRPMITKLNDGTLVVVYQERYNGQRMMAVASFDHGQSWETHRKLVICDYQTLDFDHGYPVACQSGPDELISVWSHVHSSNHEVYGAFLDTRFFRDVYGGVQLTDSRLPLDGRCIARWSFDELSGDIVHDPARHNYGYIVGAERVQGRMGQALRFDGKDDHVMVMDADILRLPQFYTLEAWINTDDASRRQTIFDKTFGNMVKFIPYRLELIGGKLRFTTGIDSFTGERSLESEQWYHVAVVVWPYREYDKISLFVNGERDGDPRSLGATGGPDAYLNALRRNDRRVDTQPFFQKYQPMPRRPEPHALTIGINKDYASYPFVGMIDEPAIYCEPLKVAEIRQQASRRYVNTGRIVSPPIKRRGPKWGRFHAVTQVPENASLKFFIIDPHVPEFQREVTPGQDLSSIKAETIFLEAQLETTATGDQSPTLYSWGIQSGEPGGPGSERSGH